VVYHGLISRPETRRWLSTRLTMGLKLSTCTATLNAKAAAGKAPCFEHGFEGFSGLGFRAGLGFSAAPHLGNALRGAGEQLVLQEQHHVAPQVEFKPKFESSLSCPSFKRLDLDPGGINVGWDEGAAPTYHEALGDGDVRVGVEVHGHHQQHLDELIDVGLRAGPYTQPLLGPT